MPNEPRPDVVINLTLRADVADLLSGLADPDHGITGLDGVIGALVHHAWQGTLCAGSWERGWLCAAFPWSSKRLERDPGTSHHDKRGGDGHA